VNAIVMSTQQVADLLGESELFSSLDVQVRLRLAERASQRGYRRGQVVFVQDERGDRMFVVAEGEIRLLIRSPHGEEVELTRRSRADAFGEVALLDGGPRSATAEAITPAVLVGIARDDLVKLLRSEELVVDAFLHLLGGLVRRANDLSSALVFRDVRSRVAGKLLDLVAWDQRAETPAATLVASHVSQSDLAQMVGGARQTVNQVLRQFEKRGWIALHHRAFEVLDPHALQHLADG
jgi:CRP/FNR family transcriptional regulator, cyclic AMP receptor protein